MDFRTEITKLSLSTQIGYETPVLAIGSCFANRMGELLRSAKFKLEINPFGVIYNPAAILKLLIHSLEGQPLPENGIREYQGIWHSFDTHSQLSHPDQLQFERGLKQALTTCGKSLRSAGLLILTFGTAVIYRRKDSGEAVANCHKYPAGHFTKELLKPDEIIRAWTEFIEVLNGENPRLRILLTLSPVRHTKDTLQLNSLSKAILRYACHELTERFPHVEYFPAFEIMTDDLRDYRYYKDDLVHPSPFAEMYIWEKFKEACMTPSAKELQAQWEKLRKDLAHRPLQPDSHPYRQFLHALLKKLQKLDGKLDLKSEIAAVAERIQLLSGTGNIS